ncbi:MAG TPA: tyrosine-type recombinase/integrase [Puia sp.]|uniref:site-specific integrase n=1 Tax=Puia sp. TaxID=2045100 RepID=UPI002B50915A|nr:tyrosine-type recombinase/integrase [Puia sp.]HVU97783.1 tyrosine-type recombinase/integrase [Puia sp.]
MYVQQKKTLLFYIRNNKINADGTVPVYARLLIDGVPRERSVKGVRCLPDHWDADAKRLKPEAPEAAALNKKLNQFEIDVLRHADIVQAAEAVATPDKVFAAYASPVKTIYDRENALKAQRLRNYEFSLAVDDLLFEYLRFRKQWARVFDTGHAVHPTKQALYDRDFAAFKERIEHFCKEANDIFDDPDWEKTILLATQEYLLDFLQLTLVEQRSWTTLEKMWGRKRRLVEFLEYRFQVMDIPMAELQFKLAGEYLTYNRVQHGMIQNSAMKYVQALKEAINRTVSLGWAHANVFAYFKCRYEEPNHDWLRPEEMEALIAAEFGSPEHNLVRDLYVFSSFTGFSYIDLYKLSPSDIHMGHDGHQWITRDREKTDVEEAVPLLPIPLALIEKYKDNPEANRRGRLFPVPTNKCYNELLKEIGQLQKISIILRTHKARFYFANEVLYNNGVQLKTVARILGQDSIQSAEIYVKCNKTAISEAMLEVKSKLFDQEGALKSVTGKNQKAKIVDLRAV